jgi:hypothetical protein
MTQTITFEDKAMLVYLLFSQWTGRKLDRKATQETIHAQDAQQKSCNVTKKLCNCPELTAISNFIQEIRNWHYKHTSPWFDNGGRVVAATMYREYTDQMRVFKNHLETLFADFVRVYPDVRLADQDILGRMWSFENYPSIEKIRSKFDMRVVFAPLPTEQDFRIDFINGSMEEVKANLRNEIMSAQALVSKDLWNRLYEGINRVIDRLGDGTSDPRIFRDSMIRNLTEMVVLLPKLNYMDDPDLNTMAKRIETQICNFDPQTIRQNDQVRQTVANEAQAIQNDITAKMAGYL